jgi:hypothetical protein
LSRSNAESSLVLFYQVWTKIHVQYNCTTVIFNVLQKMMYGMKCT